MNEQIFRVKIFNVLNLVHVIFDSQSEHSTACSSRYPWPFQDFANSPCQWCVSFLDTLEMTYMSHIAYWDTPNGDDNYIPYQRPIDVVWVPSIGNVRENVEILLDFHHNTIGL